MPFIDARIAGSGKAVAAFLSVILVSVAAVVLVAGPSAQAEVNPSNGYVRSSQTWYVYVQAGETISSVLTKVRTAPGGNFDPQVVVTGPDGVVANTCTMTSATPDGTACSYSSVASTTGVWSVTIPRPAVGTSDQSLVGMSWDISARSAGGVVIPGRVWSLDYAQYDFLPGAVDLSLFYLSEQGYQYRIDRRGMNGLDSHFTANAFGNVDPATCGSAHLSSARITYRPIFQTDCAFTAYKIFFAQPAADLPSTVTLPDGTSTWMLTSPTQPTLDGVNFAPTSAGARSGAVSAQFSNFEGTATVDVDADGDGVFGGVNDRTLTMSVVAGAGAVDFDGLNGVGTPIPNTQAITFRVRASAFAEVHFLDNDVEVLASGVVVTRLNGPADGTQNRIFWDDTFVNTTAGDPQAAGKCSTTPVLASGASGVNSSAGVHGWGLGTCMTSSSQTPYYNTPASDPVNGGSWGNNRYIDNWASIDANLSDELTLAAGEPTLSATKTSDAGATVVPGQVVTYTLTFANTGTADGAIDSTDDLSDILDDATVTTAPASDSASVAVVRTGNTIRITGVLAPGEVAHVVYSVTVSGNGARGSDVLDNTLVPDDPSLCVPGPCETSTSVAALTVSKTSDATSSSRVGDVVTYTVTATNTGAGDFTEQLPAVVSDDLTGALDDADYRQDVQASRPGTLSYAEPRLRWSGALASGDSVELTYSVTLKSGGDGRIRNVAFEGDSTTPACDPPVDGLDAATGVPCAEAEFLLPRLQLSKTADTTELPAIGQSVTYTVTVRNLGPGDFTGSAPARFSDDLTDVVDDADLVTSSISASLGTASFSSPTLEWSGALPSGGSATIEYTLTYTGAGDHVLTNVACAPVNDLLDPTDPCRSVQIPGSGLQVRKTSDPASGTTVRPGQILTYTLTFANTGQTSVVVDRDDVLAGVADDADLTTAPVASSSALEVLPIGNGRFTIRGSVAPGASETVTYAVTVKPAGAGGDGQLDNFVLPTGEQPSQECLPGDLTCTVNYVSDVSVTKSSNPDSGTVLSDGQWVTYTLRFTHESMSSITSAAVDYTDHLADVLDDAALVGGPTAGDPALSATVSGHELHVTGTLAPGASAIVSYTVKVNPYSSQGNHHLLNIVARTGDEPICAPGNGLCTTHDTRDPMVPLPGTGANVVAILFSVFGFVSVGGLLFLVRRRVRV